MATASALADIPLAPGHLPVLGHTLPLLRDRLGFLASLPAHGDLLRLRLGSHTMVMVCEPSLTQAVLRDDRTFDKGGPFYDQAIGIVGDGLASCPHSRHRRQRRLCQPAFRSARLPDYIPAMTAAALQTAAGWRDGQVVDIKQAMMALANQILVTTMFGHHLPTQTTRHVTDDTTTLVAGVIRRMMMPAPLDRLPTPGNRRFRQACARLRRTVADVIADRRSDAGDRHDLLSALLAATEPDATDSGPQALTDQELADQVITFFIAGTETTAGALTWTLYELARHPDIQERLHAHTDQVLEGRPPQDADLPRLTGIDQAFTEALRLHAPGWLFTRTVTADTTLAGTRLQAGTTIVFSPYTLHWNPDLHPDPRRFLPGRRQDHPAGRAAYIPFTTGPRQCIAERFARQEAAVILAVLTSTWTFTPVTGQPARLALSAAATPRELRLQVHARHSRPGDRPHHREGRPDAADPFPPAEPKPLP
ncbi:cytochrome P450 [Streptomyces sp. NPDC093094]|uniref:cytochrome P450 n=1 Tax=Streptomyces sp. NPDC093094 TaxID=3366026 RepID=UPI0037FCFAA6